ncbi:MAG: HPr kinase/phosphatase C-terminal domain-containing protein [Alphaproteobacteria bacterium]|nr:HPr kinase/phosphatase C-terminal domain-containing protein [Alphaproteobacteria bacterium]
MYETLLHGDLVEIDGYGVLLTGKSGVGKSDLALRLIENKNAILVADDMVRLAIRENKIYGSAPDNIKGLLEVRGVGIMKYKYKNENCVDLIVNLREDVSQIDRMPKKQRQNILGVEIVQIDLYAKESSAPDKVMTVLRMLSAQKDNTEEKYQDVY